MIREPTKAANHGTGGSRLQAKKANPLPALDLAPVYAMVVDDNRHMRRVIGDLLRAFGVGSVAECSSAAQATRELQKSPADIVLLDLLLAGAIEDGLGLLRQLRSLGDPRICCAPIVMLSGYAEPVAVARARDAGANDFIVKPVTSAQLYARVVTTLAYPRIFVRAPSFFGPDRRRRLDPRYRGANRRGGEVLMIDL